MRDGIIRWGIIGCGDVCEVKSGPALYKVEGSSLVAVMRRDLEKARDFAKRHQVAEAYDDAKAILTHEEIDAIYVATPPSTHESYTISALESRKFVYVEKPVTTSSESLTRMVEAEKKYGGKVVVAHYRRALPLFNKVKEYVSAGRLGKVNLISLRLFQSPARNVIPKVEENWRINPLLSGGGLFHDLAPHQLDIIAWLFGEPESIKGHSFNQGKVYSAPDVTTLEMKFKEDLLFQGLWSFHVNSNDVEDTCHIMGEKGSLKFSFFTNPTLTVATDDEQTVLSLPHPPHIQQPMIERAMQYFRGDGENPCSLTEALVSMRMMDATLG